MQLIPLQLVRVGCHYRCREGATGYNQDGYTDLSGATVLAREQLARRRYSVVRLSDDTSYVVCRCQLEDHVADGFGYI